MFMSFWPSEYTLVREQRVKFWNVGNRLIYRPLNQFNEFYEIPASNGLMLLDMSKKMCKDLINTFSVDGFNEKSNSASVFFHLTEDWMIFRQMSLNINLASATLLTCVENIKKILRRQILSVSFIIFLSR